jgi:hypothetical protein
MLSPYSWYYIKRESSKFRRNLDIFLQDRSINQEFIPDDVFGLQYFNDYYFSQEV